MKIYLIIISEPIKLNRIVFVCHKFTLFMFKSILCYLYTKFLAIYVILASAKGIEFLHKPSFIKTNNVLSTIRRHKCR